MLVLVPYDPTIYLMRIRFGEPQSIFLPNIPNLMRSSESDTEVV